MRLHLTKLGQSNYRHTLVLALGMLHSSKVSYFADLVRIHTLCPRIDRVT
jgi:hypothetical protein